MPRGLHFFLEGYPGGSLLSPDLDTFEFRENGDSVDVDGNWSSLPTLKLGLGFETRRLYLDASAGGGLIWNPTFLAPQVRGEMALRLKLGELFTLGPRVGVVYFGEPYWFDDEDVDLSDSVGLLAGLGLTVGWHEAALAVNLDYLAAELDVDSPGFPGSSDELDISGVLLQIGIILRF